MLIKGWKFIAASYIIYTILFVFKAVKTSMRTKIPVGDLIRKIKPLVHTAFTTGSLSAPVKQAYEVSKDEFNIKPGFVSFWFPMCCAMLNPYVAVNLVLGTMMAANLTGLSTTTSFLFVMIILVLELSLATPGTTAGWVIMLESFSMPTDCVGLFSAYRLFTQNYASGVTFAYDMFEEVEMAYKMGAIENQS